MESLPFIVVHGWWLSKLVVVLATSCLVILCLRVRAHFELRRALRQVRELERAASSLVEGRVTVRGVLHGPDVMSRHHPRAVETVGGGQQWLVVSETPVELEGAIEIARGTSSRSSWWSAGRAAKSADAAYSDPGPRVEHIIHTNDDVFATGVARLRTPSEVVISLEKRCWVLSDVVLHAVRPVACSRALGPRLVVLAVGCFLVALIGLREIGAHMLRLARASSPSARLSNGFDGLEPAAIAAALPGSREEALSELAFAARSFARTEHAANQRTALASLREGCGGRVLQQLREGRFAQALTDTQGCSDVSAHINALLFNARYESALSLMTSENASFDEHLLGLIATRRWSDGAAAVERMASVASTRRAHYLCIAAAMHWFRGERREPAETDDSLACRVWKELAVHGSTDTTIQGLIERNASGHRAVIGATQAGTHEPWLAMGLDQLSDTAREWRAVWHVYAGDFHAAEQVTDALPSSVGRMAVSFRSGTPIPTDELPAGDSSSISALRLRAGRIDRELVQEAYGAECDVDMTDAVAAAIGGNPIPLSNALEGCRDFQLPAWAILAVAPFTRSPRFATVVEHAFSQRALSSTEIPFSLVADLALRRDLSRLAGGTQSDELQGLITRHMDAFREREQVIALLLVRSVD